MREPALALKILAALTRCSEPQSDRPRRRALAVGISGEPLPLLAQIGFCARHGIRTVMLEDQWSPSAGLVHLLREFWPRRTLGTFDPLAAQDGLSKDVLGNAPADPGSVEDLRSILTRGRLVLHPAESSAENLENVCLQEMIGDKALRLAIKQRESYLSASSSYAWPVAVLTHLGLLLSLAATFLSIAADELYDDYNDYDDFTDVLNVRYLFYSRIKRVWVNYAGSVVAAVPAILAVLEVLAIFARSEPASAAERAAGLVERAVYLYRSRAGSYADLPLSSETASDISTLRRRMLMRDLSAVGSAVDESGATLTSAADAKVRIPMAIRRAWCMCCCRPAPVEPPEIMDDRLDGDTYLQERLLPALRDSTSKAKQLLVLALSARCLSLISFALGTALALLGLLHWVAVAVAVAGFIPRLLRVDTLEERRRAQIRVAKALNAAKVRWEALPAEAHSWQTEVDALVLRAEQAIESTLPSVPGFGAGSGGLVLTSLVFEVYTE